MIKQFAVNCISDEIHHPIITKLYRTFLIFVVFCIILITLFHNHLYHTQHIHNYSYAILLISYLFLLIDYLLRIIGSYAHYDMENYDDIQYYASFKNYIFSYYGIVDLLSAIPFFIFLFDIQANNLLIVLSMISLLKLSRFSPALIVLKDVIISEKDALLAALYMMIILTFSLSTALYFIEKDVNKGFSSLFDSIWWAVITLSTVGYGDVHPVTYLGKFIGGIAAITGFGMFALPAGILASGFAQEVKRLKNVTTWKIVNKVPLFSELEFGIIAEISKMLHIKRFRKNEQIIKEGNFGDSMYFILKGSVLVYNDKIKTTLESGDFFGEIALLKNIPRTANVMAKERCELLELTTYDFKNFIKSRPELAKKIEEIAMQRYTD